SWSTQTRRGNDRALLGRCLLIAVPASVNLHTPLVNRIRDIRRKAANGLTRLLFFLPVLLGEAVFALDGHQSVTEATAATRMGAAVVDVRFGELLTHAHFAWNNRAHPKIRAFLVPRDKGQGAIGGKIDHHAHASILSVIVCR